MRQNNRCSIITNNNTTTETRRLREMEVDRGNRDLFRSSVFFFQYIFKQSVSVKHSKFILWAISLLIGVAFITVICTLTLTGGSTAPPPQQAENSSGDNYTVALHRALQFFDAQQWRKQKNASRRGEDGMKDGYPAVDHGLVGGYYDGRDYTKLSFPMAFSITLLSWSVIEYSHKYKEMGEYDHVRQVIRWGTDYLVLTFDNTADSITSIYSEVGVSLNHSTGEDVERTVLISYKGSDLAGEMAAALASAAIVFHDDVGYAKKLLHGASILFDFANQRPGMYNHPVVAGEMYNSTGFHDELLWCSTWLFYASGNLTYIQAATDETQANVFSKNLNFRVLDWDNKLPGAELALTPLRMFLNPGYPYEDMLSKYHQSTDLNMCSYLPEFRVIKMTKRIHVCSNQRFSCIHVC